MVSTSPLHPTKNEVYCMLRCSQKWHQNCRTISVAKLHYTNWIKTEADIMSGYRGSMHLTNPSCWAGRGPVWKLHNGTMWRWSRQSSWWPHHHDQGVSNIQQQHNNTNNITTSRGWALDSSLFRMVLFKHIYIVDCHSLNNHVLQLL